MAIYGATHQMTRMDSFYLNVRDEVIKSILVEKMKGAILRDVEKQLNTMGEHLVVSKDDFEYGNTTTYRMEVDVNMQLSPVKRNQLKASDLK